MSELQNKINEALTFHKAGKFKEAEEIYNKLLGLKYDDPGLLYLMGDLCARTGRYGVAINLFAACLQIKPDFQEALIDLGVAFKACHHNVMAKAAWERAIEVAKPVSEIYTNLATLYADSGNPDEALKWIEKAEAMGVDDFRMRWNKALALLSKGEWSEAWGYHEARRSLELWHPRTRYKLDDWDGEPGKHVLVHGEQGLGDEIMYLSCMPDVLALAKRVTMEVEPRLIPIVERSFGVQAFASENETPPLGYDCQIPLATLPKLFRNTDESFPGTPYLKPNPTLVEQFKRELRKLGPPPYIALGWYGGIQATRPQERTIPPGFLTPIRAGFTCVSAQYGIWAAQDAMQVALPVLEATHGKDLDAQMALVAAVDLVVTPPQTLVHVAGSVGTPAIVLTPSTCSWRYGIRGERMPWYGSVRLMRQANPGDWRELIDRVAKEVEVMFKPLETEQCASAS